MTTHSTELEQHAAQLLDAWRACCYSKFAGIRQIVDLWSECIHA
jgi:hypothetical protein